MFHLFLVSFTTAGLSHESLCPAPQRQLLVLPASLAILPSALCTWASGIFSRISQILLFPCSNTPWFPISLRIHSKVTMLAYTAPLGLVSRSPSCDLFTATLWASCIFLEHVFFPSSTSLPYDLCTDHSPRLECSTNKPHVTSLIFFFIEVELIYNIILVSGIQHSDSIIFTDYTHIQNMGCLPCCIRYPFSLFILSFTYLYLSIF